MSVLLASSAHASFRIRVAKLAVRSHILTSAYPENRSLVLAWHLAPCTSVACPGVGDYDVAGMPVKEPGYTRAGHISVKGYGINSLCAP